MSESSVFFFYAQLHVTSVWSCGMNSKRTIPLISKTVMSTVFICNFDMRASFGS
jgi:hypothetical protein